MQRISVVHVCRIREFIRNNGNYQLYSIVGKCMYIGLVPGSWFQIIL